MDAFAAQSSVSLSVSVSLSFSQTHIHTRNMQLYVRVYTYTCIHTCIYRERDHVRGGRAGGGVQLFFAGADDRKLLAPAFEGAVCSHGLLEHPAQAIGRIVVGPGIAVEEHLRRHALVLGH